MTPGASMCWAVLASTPEHGTALDDIRRQLIATIRYWQGAPMSLGVTASELEDLDVAIEDVESP